MGPNNEAAVLTHEKAVAELACRELTAERDRLKATNAELVEVLENTIETCFLLAEQQAMPSDFWEPSVSKARAALNKARKEG